MLYRGVKEFLNPAEIDDGVELLPDLCPPHPKDGAVTVTLLPSRKLGMKSRTHREERCHPAVDLKTACTVIRDARKDFQQRAFSCAVAANDANRLAFPHIEGY